MARLTYCTPSQYVVVDTPFNYQGSPIRVTINKHLRRRFLKACRRAKNRAVRRRVIGNSARRIVRVLDRSAGKFTRPPKWAWNRRNVRGWFPKRIDSYNCRKIAGTDKMSNHAKAGADDFFATPPHVPPPGGVWEPDNGMPGWFAEPFEKLGFTWGARWSRKDVPHIEWTPDFA